MVEGFENQGEIMKTIGQCLDLRIRALASADASLFRSQDDTEEAMTVTDGLDQAAFVAVSNGEVVGVIVAENERDIKNLCSSFAVEEFVSVDHLTPISASKQALTRQKKKAELDSLRAPRRETAADIAEEKAREARARTHHANVVFFLLNPLLQKKRNFILRELMRIYRKKVVYYRVAPDSLLQNVTDSFVQVPHTHPMFIHAVALY